MTDPTDKKINEKRDNLDAMLDEADASFLPMNEFQDDEDTIDRLLMNTDFDVDNTLIPTEANKDIDELDDFLSFDDFRADFNEPKIDRQDSPQAAEVEAEPTEQAVRRSSFTQSNESEGDEDALDRLLMSVNFDADGAPVYSDIGVLEELEQVAENPSTVVDDALGASASEDFVVDAPDDFSDFSDFMDADIIPSADDVVALSDEVDDFSGVDVDESDLLQDDEVETSADLIAPNDEPLAADNDDLLPDVGLDTADLLAQADGKIEFPGDVAVLSDEVDDFSGVDVDESDLLQDDEVETSADLIAPNDELLAADNDDLLPDVGLDTADVLAQADEKTEAVDEVVALPAEMDDFSGYGDDFDTSDMIQDDENSFANLLADAGFDSEDALEPTAGKKDAMGDDSDLNKIDDFFQLDEVSDDFSKEMEATQLADTDNSSDKEDDFLLPDFDITADMDISDIGSDAGIQEDEFADAFGDSDFLNEDVAMQAFESELQPGGNEAVVEAKPKQTVDTIVDDTEDVQMSPFGFEREDIKKQLEDAGNKVKKAKLFGYVALGFGVVALSAAAGLGVMTYSAKTEVSKLTEDVSALEADLAKIVANNPNAEINAMVNSVVQLNQQVYSFITELKGNPQFPVDLLTTKVPDITVKQDRVSKALDMLQVKIGDLEEKVSLAPLDVEPAKVEVEPAPAPVKEGNTQEHVLAKDGITNEHVLAKDGITNEHGQIKEKAIHETAPAKVAVIPEILPAKVETKPEVVLAKEKVKPKMVTAKPAYAAKPVSKPDARQAIKQQAYGEWGVNLIAFKQEWFARSKAAEFARLGVFSEVVPVREQNVTMYRLRVGGFKSKADALSNTAKLKKSLNLDSVWVSDN
ncbi:MAG: SPOR domain-containing protein [Methylobacter sp.]|uniref:SPOR domain-containing protein n=1 Tax=Candidatus Methylobacter titanis TaxID=3053457 RepID=A0AA43Q7V8_9GAMM|nr:SPOR domain-containing protein [Candidatus Methylobacter titanis]